MTNRKPIAKKKPRARTKDGESAYAIWRRESGNILHHLLPYVVAIRWIDALTEPRSKTGDLQKDYDVQDRLCTGFLYQVNGVCFVITAGHVITQMNEAISPPRRLVKAQIIDSIGLGKGVEPVPFPLGDEPRFHVYRESLGWDLGAFPIPSHYVRLLVAGGRRAFNEDGSAGVDEQFDLYVVLGFPTSQHKRTTSRAGTRVKHRMTFGTPLMPVQRIVRPPRELKKPVPRFYGKILRDKFTWAGQEIHVDDIDGMSGGPIIGLRFLRRAVDFRLIGVQSGWFRPRRIIAGCPLADLGPAMLERMRQAGAKV